MDAALLVARLLLAVVFFTAGLAKLADRGGSRNAVAAFGIPGALAGPLALILPLAELVTAVALIPTATARSGALAALVLLSVFVVAISVNLAKGRQPDCHCFGQLHSSPAGWPTLIRNGLLAGVAGFIVWQGWQDGGASAIAWVANLTAGTAAALVGGAVVVTVVVLQSWSVLHLLRQYGRLLLRVDSLEAAVGSGYGGTAGLVPAPPVGLSVGSTAPGFALSGMYGETLTLAALRSSGKPVMLIFAAASCGPCEALMPEIAQWQQTHANALTIAVISSGAPDAVTAIAREHGIANVLLQPGYEVAESFQYLGTPGAVVVAPDGRIASGVVGGIDAVRSLLMQSVRGTGAGSLEPRSSGSANGLTEAPVRPRIGEPAPAFELPDLDGKPVSLSEFRGSPTLVLFWNLGCGFCRQMLVALKAWEADLPVGAPQLIVLSSGSIVDNRAMELRSTVVIDESSDVASSFGANGTPMAVLVDAEGRVASEVVGGAQAVLDLARQGNGFGDQRDNVRSANGRH